MVEEQRGMVADCACSHVLLGALATFSFALPSSCAFAAVSLALALTLGRGVRSILSPVPVGCLAVLLGNLPGAWGFRCVVVRGASRPVTFAVWAVVMLLRAHPAAVAVPGVAVQVCHDGTDEGRVLGVVGTENICNSSQLRLREDLLSSSMTMPGSSCQRPQSP